MNDDIQDAERDVIAASEQLVAATRRVRHATLRVLCRRCRCEVTVDDRAAAVAERCRLTPAQTDAVRIVLKHQRDRGVSSTLDEIATDRGTTKESVLDLVKECIAKGAMTMARSIRVVEA